MKMRRTMAQRQAFLRQACAAAGTLAATKKRGTKLFANFNDLNSRIKLVSGNYKNRIILFDKKNECNLRIKLFVAKTIIYINNL
jgi:hypothetical protein